MSWKNVSRVLVRTEMTESNVSKNVLSAGQKVEFNFLHSLQKRTLHNMKVILLYKNISTSLSVFKVSIFFL